MKLSVLSPPTTHTFVSLLAAALLLAATAAGCSGGIDDEDDEDIRTGSSTLADPDLVEGVGGDTCRDVAPDGIGAEGWLDCKIDLNGVSDTDHVFGAPEDFETNPAECAERLEVAMDIYEGDNGQQFDWNSGTTPIAAVLAKGGPHGNFYHYVPPRTEDSGLNAPECPGGKWCELSHVSFCVTDNQLDVAKTATARPAPTIDWQISKTVLPSQFVEILFVGDAGVPEYTVVVDAPDTDDDFVVSGDITIDNNTGAFAEIAGVTDEIDGVPADVTCPVEFPHTLEPNEQLECFYSARFQQLPVQNIATVTVTPDSAVAGTTAEADVQFDDTDPIEPDHELVTVRDAFDDTDEQLGDCHVDDAPCTFVYDRTFSCEQLEAGITNTARIVETGQEATADIGVFEQCLEMGVEIGAPTTIFDRQHLWEITKTATPDAFPADGQDHNIQYLVSVDRTEVTPVDTFRLLGKFSVSNPADRDVLVDNLTATLFDADAQPVDVEPHLECFFTDDDDPVDEFPRVWPSRSTPICEYEFQFELDENPCPADNQAACTIELAAEIENILYDPREAEFEPISTTVFTDAVTFQFGAMPDEELDRCVEVTDEDNEQFAEDHGTPEVCVDDQLPAQFDYTRVFSLPKDTSEEECELFKHVNIATATGMDTDTEVTAEATVFCSDVQPPPDKKD